jgi:hypothetical protein
MKRTYLDRPTLVEFLTRLGATFTRPGRLYLVGETTHVFEGWRARAPRLEFAAEVAPAARAAFVEAVHRLQSQLAVEVLEESPGDVIPLPSGSEARHRPAGMFGDLEIYHFDSYGVAFRLIARGDEPDYHAVITFLRYGWLTVDGMNALLADLLPKFTNESIQQDPAEFRRKYKGLLQMWRACPARAPEVVGGRALTVP